MVSTDSGWRSSNGCRSTPCPIPRTSTTCAPSATAWDTCWRAWMTSYSGMLRGDGLRVALVCARFNDFITERLLAGARDGLVRHGVDEASITEAWCPGAFEIPLVAKRLAAAGEYDAVITLGAVIRAATRHLERAANNRSVCVHQPQLGPS